MAKFILVIILNSVPQYIQVFDNREQCSSTAQLIRKAEHIESYCIPSGSNAIAATTKQETIG
jgi:hypothetical protein